MPTPHRPSSGSGATSPVGPVSSQLDPNELRLLMKIYEAFQRTNDWPAFELVDYELDRAGFASTLAVLDSMSSELVVGKGQGRAAPAMDQPLALTLVGMSVVAEHSDLAATDFKAFCESVMLALEIADETPPPGSPVLEAVQLSARVDLPVSGRPGVIARIGKQWSVNGHLYNGFSGENGTWTATLDRHGLRHYRGAHDKAGFVAADQARRAPGGPQTAPTTHPAPTAVTAARTGATGDSTGDSTADPTGETAGKAAGEAAVGGHNREEPPGWFSLLPDAMSLQIRARLLAGHPEDAFVQAWKSLAQTIGAFSGLPLDGNDLVNQAFRGIDRTALTSTQSNEFNGYLDLMRGLARFRNVHAHRDARPFSDLEVAAFLLVAGACVEWVESLEQPSPTDEAST